MSVIKAGRSVNRVVFTLYGLKDLQPASGFMFPSEEENPSVQLRRFTSELTFMSQASCPDPPRCSVLAEMTWVSE